MLKRYLITLVPTLLVAFLVGCGETPTPTAVPTSTATPTATPSATLAATATVRPTATVGRSAAPTQPPKPTPTIVRLGTINDIGNAKFLVGPHGLERQRREPNVRIVDLGSAAEYAAGHVAGAIRIEADELELPATDDVAIAAWQAKVVALLGGAGITADNHIIAYDHGSGAAAQLWWVLDYLGHSQKHVFDGNLALWREAGGEISSSPSSYPPATYVPPGPRPDLLASKSYAQAGLGRATTVIVDARPKAEYTQGHIAGAFNVPIETARNGKQRQYQGQFHTGVLLGTQGGYKQDKHDEVIVYCSTNSCAAELIVAFSMIERPPKQIRLYVGNWSEWIADPAGPVEP